MKFLSLIALLMIPFVPLTLFAGQNENKPTVIILLGAPGAGKGTQALSISEKLHIPHISTGDLLRENLRNDTAIGKKARKFMDEGKLVPDSLVLEMLFDRLKSAEYAKGYILDGFPRTLPQAEALNKALGSHVNLLAISLEVPDELIVERLSGRIVCSNCGTPYHRSAAPPKIEGKCDRCSGELVQRADDNEAVIRQRLNVYQTQSEPLKAYYKKEGRLILIDAATSKEKTTAEIDKAIASFRP